MNNNKYNIDDLYRKLDLIDQRLKKENEPKNDKYIKANRKNYIIVFCMMTLLLLVACFLNLHSDNTGDIVMHNFLNDFMIPIISAVYIPVALLFLSKYI